MESVGGGDYPEIMCERRTERAEGQDAVGIQQKREAGVKKRQRRKDDKGRQKTREGHQRSSEGPALLCQCGWKCGDQGEDQR